MTDEVDSRLKEKVVNPEWFYKESKLEERKPSLFCHREHGVFCHAWRSLFGFSSAKKSGIATDGLRRKIKKIENLKDKS